MALVNKPDESIFASSAKQGEVDNFPDLLRGWGITFDQTQGIPPMEWFNFLFKRLDEKHTYLMQRGLPEWSATQDYTKGSCVQFDGVSYRALKNSKNNRPNESNSLYWVRWGFALSEIARATLQQSGIVQLSSSTNSKSESEAATSKAVKAAYDLAESKQSPATTLAGYGIGNFKIENFVGDVNTLQTDGIYAVAEASRSQNLPVSNACHIQVISGGDRNWCRQIAYSAYSTDVYERHQTSYQTDNWSSWVRVDSLDKIPNNKKSSAVDSESEDNVATSKAVKTAYDKGMDAENAADNANSNANGRVSKSGDSMSGSLTIARASKKYKVGSYNWDKFIDLSGDAVIGNDKCIIGFNNNGALHLGGKPNAAEFNASIDESVLWVRGDVQTKTGKSLNKSVSIDDFTTIKAENGWTKLPTGLIIQWGQFLPSNLINNETGSMTFPQRYPNSVFCVICGSVGGSSGGGTEGFAVISQDNSKFNWKSYWEGRHKSEFPEKIQWISIGY